MGLTEHIRKSQLIRFNLIFGTQKACFLFMAMYIQYIYDMNKWATQEFQKRFKERRNTVKMFFFQYTPIPASLSKRGVMYSVKHCKNYE